MKSIRLAGLIGVLVLGVFVAYLVAGTTAAAPEKKAVSQGEKLIFESDVRKAQDERTERGKALREKRMKERTPPTEKERKKRQQEAISKKYQGMIEKQEALVAQCMKIRALAQQEKALLTIKEIDKLITEQREQIKTVKQQMQDALHPEQARQRRMVEKKRQMEEKRARYEQDRERKSREKEARYGADRERKERDQEANREKKERKLKEQY
jgi:hypothetical protein